MAKIEHVFVLMLENRSFDHLLGFSGLPGVSPPPALKPGATDQLPSDPHHEFDDVAAQINNGAMNGFEANNGPDAMKGFRGSDVPVLTELARKNLYFDNWFSSMPGPTWPNRLFAHAASSGGLDNSLGAIDSARAVTNPGYCLNFQNGHIFDRLTARGVPWRVYHHKATFNIDYPQVLCLKGMVDKRNDRRFFRHFGDFVSDLSNGDVVGYTFIEPKYDLPGYSNGNSQHPTGTISLGERLIRTVHDAIFKKSVGASSALLITWDEHGGLYDHVAPPTAMPPGDTALNHNRAKLPRNCPFNRFGVRVPAVLISPWLPAGLGSTVFGNNSHFDHASIVRALRSTFSLGPKLTDRDQASPDWNAALLSTPRTLSLKLPTIAAPKIRKARPSVEAVAAQEDAPSGNLLGVSQIAADIDWHTAERLGVPPLIVSSFANRIAHAQAVVMQSPGASIAATERDDAHLAILEYIAAVQARDSKVQAAEKRAAATGKTTAARSRPKSAAKKRGKVHKAKRPQSKRKR